MHRGGARVSAHFLHVGQTRNVSTSRAVSALPSAKAKPKFTEKRQTYGQEEFSPKRKSRNSYISRDTSFIRITDRLVKTSQREPKEGWKPMPSRRGEEMRLKQVAKGGTLPSVSKQTFDAPATAERLEEGEEDGIIPQAPLGSFVEIRRSEVSEVGVVVGSGFRDRQWQISVLTVSGESWAVLKEDCFFTIPSICPPDLAARCGMEKEPFNPTELNARIEVLKRLRTIQRDVENAMSGVSRNLDLIYETVRSKNPKEWSEVTISEIAKIIRKNPTAVEIFAVHKVLMNTPTRFVAGSTYVSSQTLNVRPLEDVEDLLQVQQWVRDKSPVIEQFAVRALEIAKSRGQLVKKTAMEAPSVVPGKYNWTVSDQTIIRFLKVSLRHSRSVQMDPYTVSLGFILRRFYGLEQITYVDNHVHQLLVDIGVLAPWQDLIVLDRNHRFDQETRPSVLAERKNDILRALEQSKNPNPIHPDDFFPADRLASIRHDWGDMPVYVIDDINAEELDDGVSVERLPSEPGNIWVHIHVADPASLIPSTNFLASKAAQQHETWYMIHKSFPLFPRCITHHPTLGLSLGIRSKNGTPDNVITFSIKVNSEGDILDYAVRAGLVRNVRVLNYDSVDAKLVFGPRPLGHPFGNPPLRPPHRDLEAEAHEDMKLLKEVTAKQRERRLAMNWFSFDHSKACVERQSEFPSDTNTNAGQTQLHRGFPRLNYYTVSLMNDCEHGTRSIIAELMKLASRGASMWFSDKSVPALRRCANPMIPASEEAIEYILNKRNHFGYLTEQEGLGQMIYTPRAHYKTHTGMHWGLGVPEGQGYVRVTSPLRRYGDLVAHWQIHEALLQEKEGRRVKGAFSLEWMENFAGTMALKDQVIKSTVRRHNRFWSLLYVKRWQELFSNGRNGNMWPKDANGEPIEDPLQNLEGYLVSSSKINRLTGETQIAVQIPKLGLKELLLDASAAELRDTEIGTPVALRISEIALGVKPFMTLKLDRDRTVAN